MKKRQDAKENLLGLHGYLLSDLMNVGKNVPMREHNPLGVAGRARGEDYRGRFIQVVVAQTRNQRPQSAERHKLGNGGGPELIRQPYLLGYVFEQNQFCAGSDLEFFEHLGRGQNVRDTALLNRRVHQNLARRIVEVDRNLAPE